MSQALTAFEHEYRAVITGGWLEPAELFRLGALADDVFGESRGANRVLAYVLRSIFLDLARRLDGEPVWPELGYPKDPERPYRGCDHWSQAAAHRGNSRAHGYQTAGWATKLFRVASRKRHFLPPDLPPNSVARGDTRRDRAYERRPKSRRNQYTTGHRATARDGGCRFYFAVGAGFPLELLPEDQGLILADRFAGEILREAPLRSLSAARRKAMLIRFARASAARLQAVLDPPL